MSNPVAALLVDTLQAAGAKNWYGIVGDTLNRIARPIDRGDKVESLMLARLEQSAEEIRQLKTCISELSSREIAARKRAAAERLELQQQLRQATKMEAIGRFASGIAHDFNNVLGGILAYGEMLFDEAADNTPRKQHARNVLTAASRGRDLVDQILEYTRGQRAKRRPTDACRAVADTVELVRSSVPASIALHVRTPDMPIVVLGDVTQLHQLVTNLCSNAVQAMKTRGLLTVSVASLDMHAGIALSHGTLPAGHYVRIDVEDNGCGMDDATLARIFEPFFTKSGGRGTGLGLAIVNAIVEHLDGVVDVKSTVGEGSSFSIYLPRLEVVASAHHRASARRAAILDRPPRVSR